MNASRAMQRTGSARMVDTSFAGRGQKPFTVSP
jgi:hypothetical protein